MTEKKSREELVTEIIVAIIDNKLVGMDDIVRRTKMGARVRGRFLIELAAAVSDALAVASGEVPYEKEEP